jgi:predicted GH43/DUF377 family glycosyl hydrolase
MGWKKLGHVYNATGESWWAVRAAHLPTPQLIDDHTLRVYFGAVDEKQFGRIGAVEVALDDPCRVLRVTEQPLLDLGELGSFDDCGVVPSAVINLEGAIGLYYVGFQRAERVPYMLFTGLAVADAITGPWKRRSRTPILDRTDAEPYSRSAPCVLREGSGYRMWYWSCSHWTATDGRPHYNTAILHAVSPDGVHWPEAGQVCLSPNLPDEYALGRPSVVRDADGYRMWFSARSHSRAYVIGYAESTDGMTWTRRDDRAGIACSTGDAWDSEMICYPAVVDVPGKRLLFYNGNRCGASGFGCAVWED